MGCNNSPTPSPKGANESLFNANVNLGSNNSTIDTALQQLQSSFCHYSKNLDNLSLSSEKIPFSIPADFKNHPFGQDTSPLTLLHVYLLQSQTYPKWRRIKTNSRLLRPLCPPASFSPHGMRFPKGQGSRDVFKAFSLYCYIGSLSISRLPKKTTFSWKDIPPKHLY